MRKIMHVRAALAEHCDWITALTTAVVLWLFGRFFL